jgi:hypothetical protein
MSGRHLRTRRSRIHVELPVWASTRQSRELSAFARYCVARIERELGELTRWTVSTRADARGGFSATVVAYQQDVAHEARGSGPDATLAIWDALCNVEPELREHAAAGAGERAPALTVLDAHMRGVPSR